MENFKNHLLWVAFVFVMESTQRGFVRVENENLIKCIFRAREIMLHMWRGTIVWVVCSRYLHSIYIIMFWLCNICWTRKGDFVEIVMCIDSVDKCSRGRWCRRPPRFTNKYSNFSTARILLHSRLSFVEAVGKIAKPPLGMFRKGKPTPYTHRIRTMILSLI